MLKAAREFLLSRFFCAFFFYFFVSGEASPSARHRQFIAFKKQIFLELKICELNFIHRYTPNSSIFINHVFPQSRDAAKNGKLGRPDRRVNKKPKKSKRPHKILSSKREILSDKAHTALPPPRGHPATPRV